MPQTVPVGQSCSICRSSSSTFSSVIGFPLARQDSSGGGAARAEVELSINRIAANVIASFLFIVIPPFIVGFCKHNNTSRGETSPAQLLSER